MLNPSKGLVLGVIGQNGIGKTTALKILSGHIKMNFGKFGDDSPDWEEIINYFKGSTLQSYFEQLKEKNLRIIHKPQEITDIPKHVKGNVETILKKIDSSSKFQSIVSQLSIGKILKRDISVLSGGELQRVAIAAALLREGDVYLIDEPTSYLDVRERLNMAKLIRSRADAGNQIIVIEHDLAILDYLSDQVCLLYGEAGAYGIISHPQNSRVGINIYLNGFIKDENMQFRDMPIRFHERPPSDNMYERANVLFEFNDMEKTLGDFHLQVYGGEIHAGEVIGILGPNGIGKTTFINMVAGKLKPDNGEIPDNDLKIAFKPQYIDYDPETPVYDIIDKIKSSVVFDTQYKKRLLKGFQLERLEDRKMGELSGGELQKIAIADCLTDDADIYLLDEPSAFLDVDSRLLMASILRKSIEGNRKCAFVVEHDIITQDFLSDSLIVFSGEPGISGKSSPPQDLRSGMNDFLKIMNITFRRDTQTGRPRVNKVGSNLDKIQRGKGEYYYIPSKHED